MSKEKNDPFDDKPFFTYTAPMSTFNIEDLTLLEKLARIRVNPDKEEELAQKLNKILSFVEMLNEVDTENTPPLTHVTKGMKAPLAEDEIIDILPTEEFLSNAPDRVGAFLKVPVVIEDKEDA